MLVLILAMACSDKGGDSAADPADLVGDSAAGATQFSSTCSGCHGADGTGGIDIGGTPSANLTERVPAMTDDEIITQLETGGDATMGPQGLSAQTTADVIAYLRETFP